MKNRIFILLILLSFSCGMTKSNVQELKIDYQVNVSAEDTANYFTFSGPIRYLSVEKDQLDVKTGASEKNSTVLFQGYRYDVKGKNVISDGLRSLFLFAIADYNQLKGDNLTVSKASDGVITIQYVHRGTAYIINTDKSGLLDITKGSYKKRAIGYIKGEGPQVLSTDFSSDGTAASVDWNKVWNANIAGGKEITSGEKAKTGNIISDAPAKDAMFYWNGILNVSFDNNILKINGGASAIKR